MPIAVDRREMLRITASALIGSTFITPSIHLGAERAQAPMPGRIDRAMAGWMKQFGVPGVAVAVLQDGRLSAAKGYGVLRAGAPAPVTADTIFEAASLGKPVFAYLVMGLAAEGVIDLNQSIGPFFRNPDFRENPAVDAITPAIVLSHRTGLSNWRPPREPDRFRFAPGTGFSYSGEGYVRLQRAVENATKEPLNDMITRRVLAPLGMTRSSYVWQSGYERTAAEAHTSDGQPTRTRLWGAAANTSARREATASEQPPIFSIPNAAASLFSSVTEYARFVAAIMRPPARATKGLLSADTISRMLTPVVQAAPDLSWGLGWGLASIPGRTEFWQWGNNGPYQGFVTASRESGEGIVILTNSDRGLRLCKEVVENFLGTRHPAFAWSQVLR